MKKYFAHIHRHPYLSSAAALVVIAIFGFVIFRGNGENDNNVLVVHPRNFSQQLSVSGTVTAAQNVDLGFAQSGRIAQVNAKVGDQVAAGTVLARIENGDAQATLAQRQAALQSAEANLHSVESGTRPEEVAVSQAQVTSDETALEQARETSANTVKTAYTTLDSSLASYIDQFFNSPRTSPVFEVVISTENGTSYRIQGGSYEADVNMERKQLTTLLSSDNISKASDITLQALQVAQTLTSNISSILAGYNPTDVSSQSVYNGFKSAVAAANSNISASITSLNQASAAQNAAQNALDKDRKSLELAQAGSTESEIQTAEANVKAAAAEVANAQAELGKTIVRAPFDGIVTKMDAKVGQAVNSNDSKISLNSRGILQIESYVPEVYISNLQVGNQATTTLDAFGPGTFFPATVVAIDPAQTVLNGVSNYKTTLQFASADPRIRVGMTASINITTASTPNAIVVPQGALFSKNGMQYARIKEGKKETDVAVTVGQASSIGEVQVLSGLRDGDSVLLNPVVK